MRLAGGATRSMPELLKRSSGQTFERKSPSVVPVEATDMTPRILRSAHAEMNHAANEYDEARVGLGDEFLAVVERALEVVMAAPHRWPRVDPRHHRYVVRRFPFSVFYRFNETEVVIVAIAHHRRQPAYWSQR